MSKYDGNLSVSVLYLNQSYVNFSTRMSHKGIIVLSTSVYFTQGDYPSNILRGVL
jgi:hypothetical protein